MTDKTRARFLRQRLMFETLESRWLLASCGQNPANQFDVNDDGTVSPQDMLVVINELNRHGASACDDTRPSPHEDADSAGSGERNGPVTVAQRKPFSTSDHSLLV